MIIKIYYILLASGNNAYRGSTFIVMEYLEHDFEGLLWN